MNKFTAKQRITQVIADNFVHVESTDDYVPIFNTVKNTVDNVEKLLLDLVDRIYEEEFPLCKRCLIAMAKREEKLNDHQWCIKNYCWFY